MEINVPSVHGALGLARSLGADGVLGDWIIAGGYVRDIVHGRTPRDVDVWCLGSTEDISEALRRRALPYEFFGNYAWEAKDGRGRLGVFKVYGGIALDIIVLDPKEHDCADSCVDDFDYNLNQYALRPGISSEPYFLGKYDPCDGLEQVRSPRMADRENKMKQIWEEIYGEV